MARTLAFLLSVTFLVQISCFSKRAHADSEDMAQVFSKVWTIAKNKISPTDRVKKFSDEKYLELSERAKSASNLRDLSLVINPFLDSLHVSHTQFETKYDLDYYFFESMFGTRRIDEPRIFHIGAQYKQEANGLFRVRSLLEGYPAQRSGLKRGDLILSAGGKEFGPVISFADGKTRTLRIQRNGRIFTTKTIKPVFESVHYSLLKATQNSEKIISFKGKSFGYIHLWAGTHELFLHELEKVSTKDFAACDGIILDIRDGYGGAWHEYLDPFFKDRSTYFEAQITGRDGHSILAKPEPVPPHSYFKKPMVLIINEGVRSGKEALAYQFKKTKRALLVGSKTPGYFATGEINFINEKRDYLLYLSISQIQLDGQIIEQVGIKPDIETPYPITRVLKEDPQIVIAITSLYGISEN